MGNSFEAFQECPPHQEHGAIAMVEFGHDLMYAEVKESQSPYGPVAFVREDGKQVLAMDEPTMAKICEDIKRATKFMMAAGLTASFCTAVTDFDPGVYLSLLQYKN